ncbi:hypothetical protein ID866_11214 [Astraeus odoratus]|nr:hypothetical protein ID866_11214 [Astraeus odoratus]
MAHLDHCQPDLIACTCWYLYDQEFPNVVIAGDQVDINACPTFHDMIKFYYSASDILCTK